MTKTVLQGAERSVAKAIDASHIVVRRSVSGCELKGSALPADPKNMNFEKNAKNVKK